MPPSELRRQRATALLKVFDRELSRKEAARASDAITLVEIRECLKTLHESTAEDQVLQIERWKAHRRVAAYPCPNCGTTDAWCRGATFWVKVTDRHQRQGAERYAGFECPPDERYAGQLGEVDRRTLPDAEPDQVFERALEREAMRRLVARVQPGTAEYLFIQMEYLDDPPLDIQTQFMMLTQAERLNAMYRLQDLFRQFEAELEADGWQEQWSDEVPDRGSDEPM